MADKNEKKIDKKQEKIDKKYEGMSSSKAKRERAKDERAQAKRSAMMTKVIAVAIVAVIVALIAAGYVRQWYIEKNKTVASTDFSAMLNDDGTIKDMNVTDYVKTFDVNGVTIAKADVEYTDEELQSDIQTELDSHKELSTDKKLTVADGDEVNIDYVGSIDGVEFDGGSAEAYDLTIGSDSFIEGFEDQLIGAHPGDNVTVNVTFPEQYENNPDLAGKDAVFEVKVNGINVAPEFTDEFVKANLSDYAQTAAEYEQYLKDTNYASKLDTAVSEYITNNVSADKYPTDYLKHLKALQMTIDEEEFNYMAQMYSAYGMSFEYTSAMQYKGATTTEEYEKILEDAAKATCLNAMAYQDLASQAGITVTDEQFDAYAEENGLTDEIIEQYGKPYIKQQFILPGLVRDYIAEHATVE